MGKDGGGTEDQREECLGGPVPLVPSHEMEASPKIPGLCSPPVGTVPLPE